MRETTRALAGRVVLVTGAGRRVGHAIARALADDSAVLALHAYRSADGAAALAREIAAEGGEARVFRADLALTDQPEALVRDVVAALGRVDVLVNSAASMERTPLDTVTPADWDRIFALNARAPFFLALAAARAMGTRGGVVVNIADHMAFESWPAQVIHFM